MRLEPQVCFLFTFIYILLIGYIQVNFFLGYICVFLVHCSKNNCNIFLCTSTGNIPVPIPETKPGETCTHWPWVWVWMDTGMDEYKNTHRLPMSNTSPNRSKPVFFFPHKSCNRNQLLFEIVTNHNRKSGFFWFSLVQVWSFSGPMDWTFKH